MSDTRSQPPLQPGSGGRPLRLASYNIQKCLGMDFRRQPRRTLQVVDRMGADIVVLQEADKRLPPRPAALPHFVLEEAGWRVVDLGGAGSLGWHGNAVVWRGDRLRLTGQGHIALPGLEPRGAVWAGFDSDMGPFRVVGMHLGLVGRWRYRQVTHLAQECARMGPMPTLWAGDFNEWSARPVLERLAPAMTFLPPRPSFPAARPMGPLDRIALGPGLRALGHGVFDHQPAQVASDHLPVWVDFLREAG